ncbi:hypothetical protein [Mucilaginibacter sp.]|jgi:hypothetical protein|uniref:hypothetical protein n=1 Tax=Mucilaginibacter sp. TaxID=1882438 RepID=UPI003565FE5D
MKILKASALILTLSAIGFYACKKESTNSTTSTAVIRNTGAVAADGCGYLLIDKSRNSSYSPVNLTDEYKVADSVKVLVTYTVLNSTFHCGTITGYGYQEAKITSISKIN